MSGKATHENVRGGGPCARTTLPAEAGSAGAARRFVRDVLANRNLEALGERAALLTSELVTNALLYTGSQVSVEVVVSSPCVRVEVRDSSPERPVRRRRRRDDAVPGHGLQLVEAMADNWGVLTDDETKCVWFELRPPPHADAAELRKVVLLSVPAAAYVALNLHLDQLLHELEVAGAPGGWAEAATTGRLHRVLSRILEDHREARVSAWDEAQRAMGVPRARLDVELSLPPSAPDSFRELVELLEEVDRLSAAGEVLTLPAPDDVRELRRWVAAEVWSQLRLGCDPQPCALVPGKAISRSSRPAGAPVEHGQVRVDEVAAGRLASDGGSAEQARRFVAGALRKLGVGDETVFRAQLLATSLVTNAARHTNTALELTISHRDDRIRIQAGSYSTAGPRPPSMEGRIRHQRLLVVEDLSEGWGVDVHQEDGNVVWYELPAV